MQFFNGRPARTWLLGFGALAALLLSGCGGGSSTSSSEGFRFVPEGQGDVIPATGLDFQYTQGSVSSGVIVSATPAAQSALPAPLPSGETTALNAYHISFSSPTVTFTPQAQVFISYDPAAVPVNSSARIYLYDPTLKTWQALPITKPFTTSPAQAQLPSTLSDQSYLAVFVGGPPASPSQFFGNYIISYTGSATGTLPITVDNNGGVTGGTSDHTVTVPASPQNSVNLATGAISFTTSNGTTFMGTLVNTNGVVTVSAPAWAGPGALAGAWSIS